MDAQTNVEMRLALLKNKIRTVRAQIIDLVARMDDVMLQQLPQIRADYALKIGCWEKALLEAEILARRAKRRLALAQAQVNRGEAPTMDIIEATLDAEFATWTAKADRERLAYEQALSFLAGSVPMSQQAAAEFKRLYRILVKRLHPDVCPGGDDERARLFLLAQAAYRGGNAEALRSLEVATRHMDATNDDLEDVDDVEALEQELELAQIECDVMSDRLRELEQSDEMRLGRLLADPQWVTDRTTELREAVEGWQRMRCAFDERLRELREEYHDR